MNVTPAAFRSFPWFLLLLIMCIGAVGVFNLHSAAAAHDPHLYLKQLGWFGIGFAVMVVVLLPDYRVTENFAYVVYAVVCLLLLAVLLQGRSAGGARRWLVVGALSFQPSEIAKLATVLCLARYLSTKAPKDGYTLRSLFRPLNISRPIAALVLVGVGWEDPWLRDPVGSFARFLRAREVAVEIGDSLWLRFSVVGVLVLGSVGTGMWAYRRAHRRDLLNPWPTGKLTRVLSVVGGISLFSGVGLWWAWDWPVVRDPIGVWLGFLYAEAGTGGRYALASPGFFIPLALFIVMLFYLAAAVAKLRALPQDPIDAFVAPADLLIVPGMLILAEPDLGTAGIVFLVGTTMILAVGVRGRSLLLMGGLGAVFARLAWSVVLKDYQRQRILTFMDPENDIQGSGWNAVQSMIAVGSGRWWGKGHLGGTQSQLSFLPEQHTDFAFSVWAEEQGFVGCLLVVGLYVALLLLGFAVAAAARDLYGSLLATGVVAIVLWQAAINIAMVIGVMPVVGLTLPLFSYGGSSVVTVLLGLALLLSVQWRRHIRS